MKKPVPPQDIEIPEILRSISKNGYVREPEKQYKEILYETPTNLQDKIQEIKSDNKNISNEDIIVILEKSENWDLGINDDGSIFADGGGYDYENLPDDLIDQEPILLKNILGDIDAKDIPFVEIESFSKHSREFGHSAPGIRISIKRENLQYKEMMQAYKQYQKLKKQFNDNYYKYDKELDKYNAYKDAKIKEIEDAEELD